jgi:eukaryotic-like serine/threonine-protein kinase
MKVRSTFSESGARGAGPSAKLRVVVGELIAGRYELHELVGSGGMSNVFRAHDRLLERSVAIKVLHEQYSADEDYVERFRREARSVAQLAHPNIVTVIDRGEEDGRQYIVFEYVEGENLKGLLSHGALPIDEALRYGLQIAGALDFAHKRGLVHRDVKPQNVLLTEEGEPKVTDFGIARSVDVQSVTQSGTVLGTSDYIAPEQARGEQVDQRTDIYSLGVMLYELLTSEVPYSGDNFVAVAMQHLHDPVPSLLDRRPDAPVRLDLAVQRAMAKDPADRFASMEELIGELERCFGELGSEEAATRIVRPPRRPRAKRPRPKIPVVPILLIMLAIAAVAGGAYLLSGGSPNVPVVAEDNTSTKPVRLTGVAALDPAGDGEHPERVGDATDKDPESSWTTEDYTSFDKDGVGLVLDAGEPVALSRITITSDEPGFPAKIRASSSQADGFVDVSSEQEVGERTTFSVNTKGKEYRYYLIWLRLPDGGVAHINEVTART